MSHSRYWLGCALLVRQRVDHVVQTLLRILQCGEHGEGERDCSIFFSNHLLEEECILFCSVMAHITAVMWMHLPHFQLSICPTKIYVDPKSINVLLFNVSSSAVLFRGKWERRRKKDSLFLWLPVSH